MSHVTCKVSGVRCQVSPVRYHLYFFYKVVGLVVRGSVINGAYPVNIFYTTIIFGQQFFLLMCKIFTISILQQQQKTALVTKYIKVYKTSLNAVQSGGASLWRVCYQQGLPRLVYIRVKRPRMNIMQNSVTFFSTSELRYTIFLTGPIKSNNK